MKRDEFEKKIKAACIIRGINIEELAALVGVTNQSVYGLFNGKSNSVRLAVSICQALDLPVVYAYRTCGLPIPEPEVRPDAA